MALSLVDDLRQRLAAGKVLVVAGNGVSAAATGGAGLWSWPGLVESGLDWAAQSRGVHEGRMKAAWSLLSAGDSSSLSLAAELATESLGGRESDEFANWLRETVGSLALKDPTVAEALVSLGVPVATTNYDDLIEQASGWAGVTWLEGAAMQHALQQPADRVVAHLHGYWRSPRSVILGVRSYDDLSASGPAQALQRTLATMSSLLFVGVGDTAVDPNLAALRTWLARTFPGAEHRHFRLCLNNEIERLGVEHTNEDGIVPVSYGDNHDQLADFLRSLATGRRTTGPMTPPGVATGGAPSDSPGRPVAVGAANRQLFVVMPFGTREVHHAPGRALDFDELYSDVISRAADNAVWDATRIDDVVAPGVITDQYLQAIVGADLVLADISIPNGNVYYELGIRHAVSAGGTLLIAVTGTQIPFDLSMHRVLLYEKSQEGYDELRARIAEALRRFGPSEGHNPVRVFLERVGLQTSPTADATAFERDLAGRVERARNREQLIAVWQWARPYAATSTAPLQGLAARLADFGEWSIAADILAAAAAAQPADFEIHRQRGWYLRQLGDERDLEAATAFEQALALNPDDPETLGMMAGRLKRRNDLEGASRLYQRAAKASPNNNYFAVNLAACRVLLDPDDPKYGLALYHELAERLLGEFTKRPADEWDEIVLAEALFAIGDDDGAKVHYAAAEQLASSTRSLDSAADQLRLFERAGYRPEAAGRLRSLLKRTPAEEARQRIAIREQMTEPVAEERPGPLILHLSDVHFAGRNELGTNDARHRFYKGPDSQTLLEELHDELVSGHASVKLTHERLHVVVSGDLAWTGSEEEFEQALELLEGLTGMLAIGKERVHLVPGNHDVNWSISEAKRSRRLENYLRLLVNFYGSDFVALRHPFIGPLEFAGPAPQPHELISVALDKENRVLICGLNSCVLEDEQHHFGYVGRMQIRALKRHLANLKLPGDIARVAVMHHHLHPFPEYVDARESGDVWMDISVVRDAGVLERELEQLGFDLVLHGHKHKPQLRETRVREAGAQKDTRPPLIVCGAGSVSCTELEHAQANHYEVIDVLRAPRQRGAGFARVVWRELQLVSGAEWTTAQSWTLDG